MYLIDNIKQEQVFSAASLCPFAAFTRRRLIPCAQTQVNLSADGSAFLFHHPLQQPNTEHRSVCRTIPHLQLYNHARLSSACGLLTVDPHNYLLLTSGSAAVGNPLAHFRHQPPLRQLHGEAPVNTQDHCNGVADNISRFSGGSRRCFLSL